MCRQFIFLLRELGLFFNRKVIGPFNSILSSTIQENRQYQRFRQEILLDLDVERAQAFLLKAGLTFSIHLMTPQIHHGSLLVDPVPYFHEISSISDQLWWYSCSHCDIPSMQIHVTPLYSLNTESTHGCKVLGQAH